MQEFASVMVTVYAPADKPVAVAAVPPPGDQIYVNGPAPPLARIVAAPVVPPLQATFVCEAILEVIAFGCEIVTVWASVHKFASVRVIVYVPAESPVAVAAVPPLGDQL